jgi:hypothetical protein
MYRRVTSCVYKFDHYLEMMLLTPQPVTSGVDSAVSSSQPLLQSQSESQSQSPQSQSQSQSQSQNPTDHHSVISGIYTNTSNLEPCLRLPLTVEYLQDIAPCDDSPANRIVDFCGLEDEYLVWCRSRGRSSSGDSECVDSGVKGKGESACLNNDVDAIADTSGVAGLTSRLNADSAEFLRSRGVSIVCFPLLPKPHQLLQTDTDRDTPATKPSQLHAAKGEAVATEGQESSTMNTSNVIGTDVDSNKHRAPGSKHAGEDKDEDEDEDADGRERLRCYLHNIWISA